MKHQLLLLLDLHENLTKLDSTAFVTWLEYFVNNIDIGKQTIIAGIFRELYSQGQSFDATFLTNLINQSNCLLPRENKHSDKARNGCNNESNIEENDSKTDYISGLPNSLLANIASYLETKELFANWNNVSHLFVAIGLSPEAIKHWNCDDYDVSDTLLQNPPKFRLDTNAFKLESLVLDCDFKPIFDPIGWQWPKTVRAGCIFFFLQT